MALDAEGRRLSAKVAGHASQKKRDRHAVMAKAREGLDAKYEREVDPEGVLDPEERARRAESAKKEDYARRAFEQHKRKLAQHQVVA